MNKMLLRLLEQTPYAENEDALAEMAVERAADLVAVFGVCKAIDWSAERAFIAFDVPAIREFWDRVEESIKYGRGEDES